MTRRTGREAARSAQRATSGRAITRRRRSGATTTRAKRPDQVPRPRRRCARSFRRSRRSCPPHSAASHSMTRTSPVPSSSTSWSNTASAFSRRRWPSGGQLKRPANGRRRRHGGVRPRDRGDLPQSAPAPIARKIIGEHELVSLTATTYHSGFQVQYPRSFGFFRYTLRVFGYTAPGAFGLLGTPGADGSGFRVRNRL